MQTRIKWLINWSAGFGVNLFTVYRGIKGFPLLLMDYVRFKQRKPIDAFPIRLSYPCPADRYDEAGVASGHYFHQDLLVARKIFERDPKVHVDIGSRLDGFVAHVASFREVEVLDIRPITKSVSNMVFRQFDLINPSTDFMSYCDSLSCLHTLEHVGLGRYGDSLAVNGYITCFETLFSILRSDGILYLSVPIGPQRIEFNAHRVLSIRTILDMAEGKFDLIDFSYVDDSGDLHEELSLSERTIESSLGCWYGCGIFEFRKK